MPYSSVHQMCLECVSGQVCVGTFEIHSGHSQEKSQEQLRLLCQLLFVLVFSVEVLYCRYQYQLLASRSTLGPSYHHSSGLIYSWSCVLALWSLYEIPAYWHSCLSQFDRFRFGSSVAMPTKKPRVGWTIVMSGSAFWK